MARLQTGDWWEYTVEGSVAREGRTIALRGEVRVTIERREAGGRLRDAIVFAPNHRIVGVDGPGGVLPMPTGVFYVEQDATTHAVCIAGDNMGPGGSDRFAARAAGLLPRLVRRRHRLRQRARLRPARPRRQQRCARSASRRSTPRSAASRRGRRRSPRPASSSARSTAATGGGPRSARRCASRWSRPGPTARACRPRRCFAPRAARWREAGLRRWPRRSRPSLAIAVAAVAVRLASVPSPRSLRFEVAGHDVAVPSDAAAVARGRHLSEAIAVCTVCHGDDLGGRLAFEHPLLGRGYTPNLTGPRRHRRQLRRGRLGTRAAPRRRSQRARPALHAGRPLPAPERRGSRRDDRVLPQLCRRSTTIALGSS